MSGAPHDADPDAPQPHGAPTGAEREAMDDFDDVERITRAVLHWARVGLIVGLPVWLVLLLVVPRSGLGPMASLGLSSIVALAVVVYAERLWVRRGPAGEDAPAADGRRARAPRRPMSAARAVVLTLAGVALAVYAVFIIAMIVRGG